MCIQRLRFGMDKDLAMRETSAFVGSPLFTFNSSIACSRVNPLLVMCLIDSSGKDEEVVDVVAADRFD